MKSQADKLIEEKLSSLESLPEGYTPNLEAKWSIIQEATSKKPAAGYMRWIGIAASIVILLGCFLAWNSLNKPESQLADQHKSSDNVTSPAQPDERKNNVIATASDEKVVIRKKTTVSKREEILKVDESKSTASEEETVSPAIPVEEQHTLVVNDAEPKQISNQRYVEVDFQDPVAKPVAQNDNKRKQVKISIGLKEEPTTSANSEKGSTLRIKQNF